MDVVVDGEFLGAEDEAELVAWLVKSGDTISVGEPLAEIETSKASAQLCSPGAGAIELLVDEGALVEVGSVIARLE